MIATGITAAIGFLIGFIVGGLVAEHLTRKHMRK